MVEVKVAKRKPATVCKVGLICFQSSLIRCSMLIFSQKWRNKMVIGLHDLRYYLHVASSSLMPL